MSLLNGDKKLIFDRNCKTRYTVGQRLRAQGKPDSNEEKNANPTSEVVFHENH